MFARRWIGDRRSWQRAQSTTYDTEEYRARAFSIDEVYARKAISPRVRLCEGLDRLPAPFFASLYDVSHAGEGEVRGKG